MRLDYRPVEPTARPLRRVAIIASLCVVGLTALVSRASVAHRHEASQDAVLPEVAVFEAMANEQAIQSAVSDPIAVPAASEWSTVDVQQGQTLQTVLEAAGDASDAAAELLAAGGDSRQLAHLKAGDRLEIRRSGDQVEELHYAMDALRTLQIRRVDDHLEATTLTAGIEHRVRTVSGVIDDDSLSDAAAKAGLPGRMITELTELFRYDIDFALDLRDGDRFSVVYEELYKDGAKLRDGDLLAAKFVNQGQTHRAVRYVDSEGRAAFYTPEGQSLRKAFFRNPLDVVRISSPFNLHRRHPILNTIRAHKGVDYAAAAGTPIKATGDGRVEFLGVKGGYGRVIVLQHGAQYETVYAHMSRYRRGLRAGDRVKQGQVIGYVGESGLATAPHLHYELRVNGLERNPVNLAMPRANPIAAGDMRAFRESTEPLVARFDASGAGRLLQVSAAEVTAPRQTAVR